jgi:phosphoribosylanthranilate isomerase
MGIQVKICGITRVEDALAAAESGADFIGVIVEIGDSPRSVSPATAQRIIAASRAPVVMLLEKSPAEIEKIAGSLQPYAVQLVGEVEPETVERLVTRIRSRIWKTVQVPQRGAEHAPLAELRTLIEQYHSSGVEVVVLDTLVNLPDRQYKGGTGRVCDWETAQRLVAQSPLPLFLAGGITPSNAREAITSVHPAGIDLSSGVEAAPGKKDPHKIVELMRIVRTM